MIKAIAGVTNDDSLARELTSSGERSAALLAEAEMLLDDFTAGSAFEQMYSMFPTCALSTNRATLRARSGSSPASSAANANSASKRRRQLADQRAEVLRARAAE